MLIKRRVDWIPLSPSHTLKCPKLWEGHGALRTFLWRKRDKRLCNLSVRLDLKTKTVNGLVASAAPIDQTLERSACLWQENRRRKFLKDETKNEEKEDDEDSSLLTGHRLTKKRRRDVIFRRQLWERKMTFWTPTKVWWWCLLWWWQTVSLFMFPVHYYLH